MEKRTRNFQALRIIALIAIVASHCGVSVLGDAGEWIPLFFSMSGFLFCMKNPSDYYSLSHSIKLGVKYWYRKFKSIYPIWLFVLLLDTLFVTKDYSIDLLRQLLLLHAFIPTLPGHYGSIWFISALLFCYFFAPLLSSIACLIDREKCFAMLTLIIFSWIILFSFGNSLGEYRMFFTYINPLRRIGEYFAGMLLYRVLDGSRYHYSHVDGVICFVLIFLFVTLMHFNLLQNSSTIASLLVIAFLYLFGGPLFNSIMGSDWALTIAHYLLFVYMSQDLILKALASHASPKFLIVSCFILGLIFGIIWEFIVSLFLKRRLAQ